MSIDESNIGIGVVYIILVAAILIRSYKKGHRLFYVLVQGLFCYMLYNVLVYSILPINILLVDKRTFGIMEQVNSSDINDLFLIRFWSENIGVLCSFCFFTFLAAVLFKNMGKIYINLMVSTGLLFIKTAKILVLNYKVGEIMEMIQLHQYIGILVSCFIGYICYMILRILIPRQIVNIREYQVKNKVLNDTYEMSDLL